MMFVDWCAICGVHFTSLSAVPRHLCLRRSNVSAVKRYFICQECNKTHVVQSTIADFGLRYEYNATFNVVQ